MMLYRRDAQALTIGKGYIFHMDGLACNVSRTRPKRYEVFDLDPLP